MTSTMNSFQIPSLKLFLSHDWGLQKENHLKVKAITDILRTKIQVEQVWIDDQEISGGYSLESKITEGILNANVFLMFITKNYERKYNSGDQNDACWFEVTMAIQEKRKILPIVLSHEMSSTSQWIPPFKTRFAHLLFLDFCEGCLFQNPTILLDQKCDEIISAAVGLLLPSSLPDNTVTGSAVSVSVSVSSLINDDVLNLNLIKTKLNTFDYLFDINRLRQKYLPGTREWLYNTINNWLTHDRSKVCWIKGEAGMGKTVFASFLAEKLQINNQLLGIFFFSFNNVQKSDPCEMIKNLIYQVAHYVPEVREQILQIVTSIDNLSTLSPAELMQFCLLEIFNHLSTNLSTNNSHYNRVIILDALDEITTLYNKRQSFLYFLSHDLIKKLPNGIRVIVTGRPEEDITMALKKWDPMIIHEDDPNHKLDLQLFIQSRLSPYVANQADRESLSTILMKKSQGKFIYLEAMTEELLSLDNLTDQEARLQVLNAFPNGMSGYYYKYLTQMQQKNFAHVNPETLKRLFLIFATAKQSISKADLRILFSVNNSQLDVIMASLNAFFPFSEASGLYSIYHKTLIDYLTDSIKNTCYYVNPTEGHNFLSAILLEKYRSNKSLEADNLSVTSFKYLYLYLLDHLDEGNISNQRTTFQLLTSLQWLQSSLQWKGMQLTIKDFYKRINDETWRQFYVQDRKDIQILYQFFKLIARMSHPEGSEEWRRELCIQITGRLENHEYDSYQYSIEMKQLMSSAKEWLQANGGYYFLPNSGLHTPFSTPEIMTVPQGHYAQFITKDIIGVVYAAPLKVDFVNFRTNESIFTLNLEEESQEFNSMIVVDAKTIAICSIHDDNHCIVSLWGFFSEKKELEVMIPLPEHYEGLKLNSLLNGTVLITVASNKKEDYATCFFIWDCKSPTVSCKFILPFLASCIAVLTSNEIVFRANSNGAAGGGDPHLHRLELSTQQCTPFEKPNGYVGFSDFIILSNRNIVMMGYKRLSLWSSYQLVSRSPSQPSSIVSIAEYNNTPNLIFVHSETVIRIIDVMTWDCIQLITINAIHDKIISCNATLLGISFGETITVYDFSLFGSMRISSNNTNDSTRSILLTSPSHNWKKRNLPFFLSYGKNQVIIIDENLAEKIVQLKLSKMGVNYFHENEKTGIIESEFPMIIPSGDKEQFLYITLYKVAVWSLQLQSNPFIMSHNNSIVGGIIFSFTPYIILIERIAAGKFCLKIYISASSFEYDFDIGTKLPELYEVLNQPILLIKIESKCYFLHLEKRKLKICNELDDMIPFVSSDVLPWITDPSKLSFMIDKINWGAETLTFRVFDWNSLYVYSRQNSLPLFAMRNGATPLGRISLDSNDRSLEFYYGENATLFDLEKKSYYTLATDSPIQYEPSTIQSIVKKLSSVRGNRVEN